MGALRSIVLNVVSVLFLGVTALCLTASWLLINVETTIMLLIFIFLFVSLTFQLNGTFALKTALLALGNLLGLLCNFVFVSLGIVGNAFFGQFFDVLYAIGFPIGNTLWIIVFWSISLTALPKPADSKPEMGY